MVHLTSSEIIKMQIKRIEKEIRDTPYHKGTERHIGLLRARLSRLKDRVYESETRKGGGGGGYAVRKQGDATVTLVGPPSVGKSTLINKLTNANSKIAPYAFTTLTVIPGMMEYKDARIQILDIPGLIVEAEKGKGRGREVLSVIRNSDLLIILCDIETSRQFDAIVNSLERAGIRINKQKPDILLNHENKGGINIITNLKLNISEDTIKDIAFEFGFKNGEITIKEKINVDQLIDTFSKNTVYIKAIFVLNKVDQKHNNIGFGDNPIIEISAEHNFNLDKLREIIWTQLDFMRVYLIGNDEKPNYNNPMIVKHGQSLNSIAQNINTEFLLRITRARIWGNGAKFPGQEVSLSTAAQEGMIINFI